VNGAASVCAIVHDVSGPGLALDVDQDAGCGGGGRVSTKVR
jgi:hypothetical protein